MSLLDFFSNLFCGSLTRENEVLKKENQTLQDSVNVLSKNYVSCLSDKSQIILNCNKDNQYLSLRVLELTQILAKSIILPELILTEPYVTVEPDALPELYDYDMMRADLVYYAFPKDTWLTILSQIQPVVKKCLKNWVSSISDCDDWALVMNAFLVAALKDARLEYQGAFTIAWSHSHAYNLYVDNLKQIWIYEPQNNTTIGLLGEGTQPYDTQKIWFIGKQESN